MIRYILRLFGNDDRNRDDDAIFAYIEDRASDAEYKRVASEIKDDSTRASDLESLRETVRLLRQVEPIKAPRSFAVTETSLNRQGYSEREIEQILNSKPSFIGTDAARRLSYVPLVIAGFAALGVTLLSIGEFTGGSNDRAVQKPESADQFTVAQTIEIAKQVKVETIIVENQVQVAPARVPEIKKEAEVADADILELAGPRSSTSAPELTNTPAPAPTSTLTPELTSTPSPITPASVFADALPTVTIVAPEPEPTTQPSLSLSTTGLIQLILVIVAFVSILLWIWLRRLTRFGEAS